MTATTGFLWNIFLAVTWAAATADLTPGNIGLGFVLGFAVLWVAHRALPATPYFTRVRQLAGLVAFFLWDLVLGNLRVAREVMTPGWQARPAIVAVPLETCHELELLLLANIVSLTPGTLTLDVADDCGVLYVYAMYAGDPEAVRRSIKTSFERRILDVLGRP